CFFPETGNPVLGALDKDGKFFLSNVAAGKFKVTVETRSVKRPKLPKGIEEKFKEKLKFKFPDRGRYIAIPLKYADVKTTPLVVEVQRREEEIEIKLAD